MQWYCIAGFELKALQSTARQRKSKGSISLQSNSGWIWYHIWQTCLNASELRSYQWRSWAKLVDEIEFCELAGQVRINSRPGGCSSRPTQWSRIRLRRRETHSTISHYALVGWELRCEPVVDSAGRNHNRVCEGQTECVITDWHRCVSAFVRGPMCASTRRGIPPLPFTACQSKPCDNILTRNSPTANWRLFNLSLLSFSQRVQRS